MQISSKVLHNINETLLILLKNTYSILLQKQLLKYKRNKICLRKFNLPNKTIKIKANN